MSKIVAIGLVAAGLCLSPLAALAQPACSSPAFEARLVAAMTKGEAQLKSMPAGKIADYARCYARTACASLRKTEFEMYALSQIASYGDDKAEKEYLARIKRDRQANDAAGDKLPPNALEARCKRETGVK